MDQDDDFGSVLAAGLLGVGAGLLLASTMRDRNEGRREAFRLGLAAAVAARNLQLRGSTLGRTPDNRPVWLLTLGDPFRIRSFRARMAENVDPYSSDALSSVVNQLDLAVSGRTG